MGAVSPLDRAGALDAVAASHESWSAAWAALTRGSTRTVSGASVAHVRSRRGDVLQVMFADPGEIPGAVADRVLEAAAELGPLREIGWWAMDDDAALGASLLARGFGWGWRPHWMGIEPGGLASDHPLPQGVVIGEVAERVDWDVEDLPNYRRQSGRLTGALSRLRPGRAVTLAAFEDDRVVGRIVLHASPPGSRGVAESVGGIYEAGVVPAARRRGIGGALTAAAVERALELGCPVVTLNATPMGIPVYRRVGFESLGWGRTWWMAAERLEAGGPPEESIRLVEAIGAVDPAPLEALLAGGGVDLEARLPCGETPLGVAVLVRRQEAARVLVAHGARLDVISAWDLGWRDQTAAMLRDRPELANLRSGEHGATPLHIAIDRDDEDLARLALAARPDLSVRDLTYDSDPMGWAEHLGRPRMAALIQEAIAG
jgi:GNAT superfamily N-acetyltransferase